MQNTPVIETIRSTLSVLLEGDPPGDRVLLRAIDLVPFAYHDCPKGKGKRRVHKVPKADERTRYDLLTSRFPKHDLYGMCDPMQVFDQPYMVDPIQQLTSASLDLEAVSRALEADGPDAAHASFRRLYERRLGRDLRHLSTYLHYRLWPPKRFSVLELGINFFT